VAAAGPDAPSDEASVSGSLAVAGRAAMAAGPAPRATGLVVEGRDPFG
jgi:hypothetical protein